MVNIIFLSQYTLKSCIAATPLWHLFLIHFLLIASSFQLLYLSYNMKAVMSSHIFVSILIPLSFNTDTEMW